jgi:hypothetical protein
MVSLLTGSILPYTLPSLHPLNTPDPSPLQRSPNPSTDAGVVSYVSGVSPMV